MWLLFLFLVIAGTILAVVIFVIATEGRYFRRGLMRWGYNRRSGAFEVRDDWERWEHLIKRLQIRSTEEILDLGTQTGHFPRLIARQRGFTGHIVGIDWSEEMIQEAQRQCRLEGTGSRVRFLCHDVQNPLPFAPNTFTLVTVVTGLLTSLKTPETLFEEIHRILKPEGRVAFHIEQQPLRPTPMRTPEWFSTHLEPHGFIYSQTVRWTPAQQIIIFQKR